MSFGTPSLRPVQCLPGEKRDYEGYVTHIQEQFKGYRDNTISKWDSKARLNSGKASNKSFLNLDRSILGQVTQVGQYFMYQSQNVKGLRCGSVGSGVHECGMSICAPLFLLCSWCVRC